MTATNAGESGRQRRQQSDAAPRGLTCPTALLPAVCLLCSPPPQSLHFDCLNPRPARRPNGQTLARCSLCVRELSSAQAQEERTQREADDGEGAAAMSGESPPPSRRPPAVRQTSSASSSEQQRSPADSAPADSVAALGLGSPARRSAARQLKVRDPAAVASAAGSAAAEQATQTPAAVAPATATRSRHGSLDKGAAVASPSSSSSSRRLQSSAATAGSSPAAASAPFSASTPPSTPSGASSLSDRLAAAVGGEEGARFALAVSAFIASARLSRQEQRDLYLRLLPNLSSNAQLVDRIRTGELTAAVVCRLSNKELADERVQRERKEEQRRHMRDLIVAPEMLLVKQTKQGLEYVSVAGQRVTQARDMFSVSKPDDAEQQPADEAKDDDAWDGAGEAASSGSGSGSQQSRNTGSRRFSLSDSPPFSPTPDSQWRAATDEEMEAKYSSPASDGEEQVEEKGEQQGERGAGNGGQEEERGQRLASLHLYCRRRRRARRAGGEEAQAGWAEA